MTSIGTFGRKRERIDLHFEFFELEVRVNPSCSRLALVEFLAEAGAVDIEDEIRGAQIIMRMLREVVHPEDFAEFFAVAKRERQDPQADLMPIAQKIIEVTADFPTGESSGSVSGESPAAPKFVADMPSQAPVIDGSILQQAMRTQGERPDLHLAIPAVAKMGPRPL